MAKELNSRHEFSDLFDMQVRGMLAGMFLASNVRPTPEQWEILRGQREPTMRDIGEISLDTDMQVSLLIQDKA